MIILNNFLCAAQEHFLSMKQYLEQQANDTSAMRQEKIPPCK